MTPRGYVGLQGAKDKGDRSKAARTAARSLEGLPTETVPEFPESPEHPSRSGSFGPVLNCARGKQQPWKSPCSQRSPKISLRRQPLRIRVRTRETSERGSRWIVLRQRRAEIPRSASSCDRARFLSRRTTPARSKADPRPRARRNAARRRALASAPLGRLRWGAISYRRSA
jgi:hypothetical protein